MFIGDKKKIFQRKKIKATIILLEIDLTNQQFKTSMFNTFLKDNFCLICLWHGIDSKNENLILNDLKTMLKF